MCWYHKRLWLKTPHWPDHMYVIQKGKQHGQLSVEKCENGVQERQDHCVLHPCGTSITIQGYTAGELK